MLKKTRTYSKTLFLNRQRQIQELKNKRENLKYKSQNIPSNKPKKTVSKNITSYKKELQIFMHQLLKRKMLRKQKQEV